MRSGEEVLDFVRFAICQNLKRDPQWALTYLLAFWWELDPRERRRYLRKLVKNPYQGPTLLELERLNLFLSSGT